MKPARAFLLRYIVFGIEKSIRLIVDDQDAHLLRSREWGVHRDKNGNRTIYRKDCGNVGRTLGQDIMQPPEGSVVWFFNGDDSDYRRANLRVSTRGDRCRQLGAATSAA